MKRLLHTFIFCLLSMIFASTSVSAYSTKTTKYEESSDGGIWYLDNNADHMEDKTTKVLLYTMIQDKYNSMGTNLNYQFDCIEGIFPNKQTSGHMSYIYDTSLNPIESFGRSKIFQYEINIEPGTYCFTTSSPKTQVLDMKTYERTAYDIETDASMLEYDNNNTKHMKKGMIYEVYALVGDEDYIKENTLKYSEWAKKRHTSMASYTEDDTQYITVDIESAISAEDAFSKIKSIKKQTTKDNKMIQSIIVIVVIIGGIVLLFLSKKKKKHIKIKR